MQCCTTEIAPSCSGQGFSIASLTHALGRVTVRPSAQWSSQRVGLRFLAGTEAFNLGALLVIGTLSQCGSSWLLELSCQCMAWGCPTLFSALSSSVALGLIHGPRSLSRKLPKAVHEAVNACWL